MSLNRFCRKTVVAVDARAPVLEAARKMKENHVGDVVVTDGGRPVGIITDRDLVVRVMAAQQDSTTTPVGSIMSKDLVTARASDNIDEATVRMRQAGVRRLPIVDERGVMVGMVTLDDLLVLLSAELAQTAAVVRDNRGP